MKSRLFTILIALFVTVTAFAQRPTRQTYVIRDGKVVEDGRLMHFEQLLGGKRAYLGVSMIDMSSELREHYGAPKDSGILVDSVADGSPADKAGVRVGDIIVAADGKDVRSMTDVRTALRDKKDGDSVRIEVLRGRSRQTLVATVVEREGPRVIGAAPADIEELTKRLGSGEWRARVAQAGVDCVDLQGRIKELETRLKDLEKKLQK